MFVDFNGKDENHSTTLSLPLSHQILLLSTQIRRLVHRLPLHPSSGRPLRHYEAWKHSGRSPRHAFSVIVC